MTPQEYEAAMLARAVWMLAISNNVNELAAIACTIRNHVIQVPGCFQTYDNYTTACKQFLQSYPIREEPTMNEPALTAYPDGLLAIIDDVYSCKYKDITATQTTQGARYFARVSSVVTGSWQEQIVKTRPILGTLGAQQFFS